MTPFQTEVRRRMDKAWPERAPWPAVVYDRPVADAPGFACWLLGLAGSMSRGVASLR